MKDDTSEIPCYKFIDIITIRWCFDGKRLPLMLYILHTVLVLYINGLIIYDRCFLKISVRNSV